MKYRYLIFMQVVGYLSGGFDNQATSLALPEIQKEMNIDVSLSQWTKTISTIAKTSFSIPLAQLGAKLGVVNSLMFFCGCCVILFPLLIITKNFYLFLFLRFLLGLSMCGAQVNSSTLYQRLPKECDRKKNAQYQQITMNIARVFGPLVSTIIIQYVGWRWVYAICAGASVLRLLNASFIPNMDMTMKAFDYGGACILIVFLTCFCLFFTMIAQSYYIVAVVLLAVFIGFFVWFIFWEKKAADPLIDIKVLVSPVPILMSIAAGQFLCTSSE